MNSWTPDDRIVAEALLLLVEHGYDVDTDSTREWLTVIVPLMERVLFLPVDDLLEFDDGGVLAIPVAVLLKYHPEWTPADAAAADISHLGELLQAEAFPGRGPKSGEGLGESDSDANQGEQIVISHQLLELLLGSLAQLPLLIRCGEATLDSRYLEERAADLATLASTLAMALLETRVDSQKGDQVLVSQRVLGCAVEYFNPFSVIMDRAFDLIGEVTRAENREILDAESMLEELVEEIFAAASSDGVIKGAAPGLEPPDQWELKF